MITNKQREALFFLYKNKEKFHSKDDFKKHKLEYNIDDLLELEDKGFIERSGSMSVDFPEPLNVHIEYECSFKILNPGIALVEHEKKRRAAIWRNIGLAIIGFISLPSLIDAFKWIYNVFLKLFS